MICPHCSANLKYKDRNHNTCSQCQKSFAFEPKTHPLQITDSYFSRTVNKLSNDGKFYFTSQQLQFAISRKKMKSTGLFAVLIILSVITLIVTAIIFYPALLVVIPFWIILMIFLKFYRKRNVSIPQTASQFQNSVLDRWEHVYKNYPSNLINKTFISNHYDDDLKGTLICEDNETAVCLAENQLGKALKLAIISKPKEIGELPKKLRELPVYVLHDASINGYEFLEKIKQQFSKQTRVIDIGLRPQAVMKTKLTQLRQPNDTYINFGNLTNEEVEWLKKGYHVPLFVMKPERLLKYVANQIGQKSKSVQPDNTEEKAKAIGFMTWAGEK